MVVVNLRYIEIFYAVMIVGSLIEAVYLLYIL